MIRPEDEEADHPHQAAIHLMKALKCCKKCEDGTNNQQLDLLQLRELQYRKNMLSEQLKQVSIRRQSLTALQSQIADLQELISRLKIQNALVEKQGLHQIQIATEERKIQENEGLSVIMTELQEEVHLNKELKRQMESLMERVKYLNRVNNDLVYNFCNY